MLKHWYFNSYQSLQVSFWYFPSIGWELIGERAAQFHAFKAVTSEVLRSAFRTSHNQRTYSHRFRFSPSVLQVGLYCLSSRFRWAFHFVSSNFCKIFHNFSKIFYHYLFIVTIRPRMKSHLGLLGEIVLRFRREKKWKSTKTLR